MRSALITSDPAPDGTECVENLFVGELGLNHSHTDASLSPPGQTNCRAFDTICEQVPSPRAERGCCRFVAEMRRKGAEISAKRGTEIVERSVIDTPPAHWLSCAIRISR